MVQILPGWGADVGNALSSIAEGIQNIQDPHWKTKRALEEHLMTDPDAMEKFVREGHANRAAYKKLGLDGLLDKFGDYMLSAGSVAINAARQQANDPNNPDAQGMIQAGVDRQLSGGLTRGAVNRDTLEATTAGGANAMIQANPNGPVAQDAYGVAAGVGTADQRTTAKNNAVISTNNATVSNAETPIKVQETQQIVANQAKFKQYENQDMNDIIAKSIDGGIPISDFEALDQGTKGKFTQLRNQEIMMRRSEMMQRYQMSREERLANQQQASADHFERNNQLRTAAAEAKSSNVSTPAMWQKFMYDDDAQTRVAELIADPSKATTPEDHELLKIADWRDRRHAEEVTGRVVKLSQTINQTFKQGLSRRVDESNAAPLLETLNGALADRHQLNPRYGEIEAVYGKPPGKSGGWFSGASPQIYFRDKTTQEPVDPKTVTRDLPVKGGIITPDGNNLNLFDSKKKLPAGVDSSDVVAGLNAWTANKARGVSKAKFLAGIAQSDSLLANAIAAQIQ